MSAAKDLRLFVYGILLSGEREHDLLGEADSLGPAVTAARYTLVDLGAHAALVAGGRTAVKGELYAIDRKQRFVLDVKREVPALFQRISVELSDGTHAEAYAMQEAQVRGKRRLASGDWRARFALKERPSVAGPLVLAARARFRPR